MDRWFITAFQETASFEAYHIVLTTDAPCHLWLRWSLNKPQRHPIARVFRGLPVMGDVYYCFTAYHNIEQDEAGDTLEHSFTMSPWPLSTRILPLTRGLDLSGPPFWEPWGDTLTENQPWYQRIAFRPISYELKDPGIYLYDPSGPGAGINTIVPSNSLPLRSASNAPLYFKARCPFAYTVFADDWISYQIYTFNGSEVQLLELVIDRGGFWGPWGSLKAAWDGKAAIDYGQRGTQFDLLAFWQWARQKLGKSTDPTGWYVATVHIQVEYMQEPTELQLTSDYLNFYHQPIETTLTYTDPRWFYFHGEVNTIASPSTSPIFGRQLYTTPFVFDNQVEHDSDDALHYGPFFWRCPINCPSQISVGTSASFAYNLGSGIRFINNRLPKGAVIDLAYLTLTAESTWALVAVKSRLSAENADNPPDFSEDTQPTFFNRYLNNTATVNFDNIAPWTKDEEYITPNIKSPIQTIVNRPGWSLGNSLVIFWEDFDKRTVGGQFRHRDAYPHNISNPKAAKLHIEYTSWNVKEIT